MFLIWIASKTLVVKYHSVSSLTFLDSSSASLLSTPGTCATLKWIVLSNHQNQISLAIIFSSSGLPPNLVIYEQLVVLSIKTCTWMISEFLQNVFKASWQALSSKILMWHLCSNHSPPPPTTPSTNVMCFIECSPCFCGWVRIEYHFRGWLVWGWGGGERVHVRSVYS